MKLVSLKFAVISIFMLSLTACGGGGGSSSTSSDSSSSSSSSSTSSSNIGDDAIDPGSEDSDAGDNGADDDVADNGGDEPAPQTLSINAQPSSQTLSSDEELSLSLQVSSSDSFTVTWYKDGQQVAQATSYQDSDLTVADTGSYSCSVQSGDLTRQCTSFTITVLDAPNVTASPSNQVATSGDDVVLSVTAEGSDLAYQWYLDGVALQGETNAQISLDSVVESDAGSYVCVITNAVGSDSSQAASVSVLAGTVYGSAEISWDRPTRRTDGSDLTQNEIGTYKVYYGLSANDGFDGNVEVDGAELSVLIEDLEVGEYKIAVSTVDSDGQESVLSDEFLLAVQ